MQNAVSSSRSSRDATETRPAVRTMARRRGIVMDTVGYFRVSARAIPAAVLATAILVVAPQARAADPDASGVDDATSDDGDDAATPVDGDAAINGQDAAIADAGPAEGGGEAGLKEGGVATYPPAQGRNGYGSSCSVPGVIGASPGTAWMAALLLPWCGWWLRRRRAARRAG
jgi:hypothetical protein